MLPLDSIIINRALVKNGWASPSTEGSSLQQISDRSRNVHQ